MKSQSQSTISIGIAGSAKAGSEVTGGMIISRASVEPATRTRYNTRNGATKETHDVSSIPTCVFTLTRIRASIQGKNEKAKANIFIREPL